ncbi:helix-turn-helix transcriptional regulator [Streptomyces sp. NBC_01244]|uniref:helix-turn-helix transcriptional regulator n=1 Tax=Streptomyces sp. NBC_01244 TaxID=2903797 RepID=UPI002E149AC0|nr:WYL domain-containing protein [Streptomyces sp. NBC_01244]
MRADRLLSLLLLLQNRGRMTAPELAAELEVSVRTVYRDVEALGASGIPVHTERGPAGGFRLVDGYRTRLTGLTDVQAGSLFLAGAPGPARDLGLGADLTAAQLKLQAALPAELGDRARRIQQRFHLDAPAWFRDADPVPHLAQIAEAVWEQRVLTTHYRRWSGAVHRALWPLGLVLKGGIWYLAAARAAELVEAGEGVEPGQAVEPAEAVEPGEAAPAPEKAGGGVRTYRVGRFLSVETPGQRFERPDGFELAAYWEESARRLEAATRRRTAVVRLSPHARRLLPMWFGAAGVRALATAGPPDAEGWAEAELAVESGSVAVGDLLRLGADAEVLGPPELRRALADAVAELAGRYR